MTNPAPSERLDAIPPQNARRAVDQMQARIEASLALHRELQLTPQAGGKAAVCASTVLISRVPAPVTTRPRLISAICSVLLLESFGGLNVCIA
jgi:hypothetical protein